MNTDELLPLGVMARRVRVSAKWLRDEAEAGRLPCLRVGRRLVFNEGAVRALLADRARVCQGGVNYGE